MKKLILSILTLLVLSLGAQAQTCYTPNWTEPSLDSMLIYVSSASLDGTNLQVGDAIGVFDGAECVGLGVLTQVLTGGTIYLIIEVSKNNPVTNPTIDGFTAGNTITYRFCSGGTVVNPSVSPTLVTNGPNFAINDSCIVQLSAVNTAPVVTSIPDTVAIEDVSYSSNITATDIDGDDLTYSAPLALPAWLSFDEGTQVLSGAPGNDEVGYYSVTLRVNDGTVDVDTTFTVRVANTNDVPTFTFVPDTTAIEDVLYTSTATAADVDVGDTLTFSATVLPTWLNFDIVTHILSGSPDNADVGDTTVTLRVNDGTVNVDTTFVIHVSNTNDAPTFSFIPDTVATENVLYTSTVTAADVDVGDTLTFSATVLPTWLNFDTVTHILSGTPDNADVGDTTVTLRVNDGTVNVDTTFVIHVGNTNDAPTFTFVPDTTAIEDALYTSTVTAADIDVGDTLTFSATVLPTWLSFNVDTHILSGTPDNADVGDTTVTLRVNDGTVNVDTTFVIHVGNTNDAPTFTFVPDTTALEDVLYTSTATAADIDVGDTLTFSAPVLPTWLNFDIVTHILSGTPDNADVGDTTVTLRVNDGTVNVDTTFVIHVGNTNDAPTFTFVPDTMATENVLYTSTVTAADIDVGDTLTFTAPVLPTWLSFNDTTNVLSGTPDNADVGDTTVTLRVNDGTVNVDTSFVIHVGNVNDVPTFTFVPDTTALQGALYSSTVTAVDIDVGDTLTFTAPVLPTWLSFNDTTNVLSGTPDNADVGDTTVTLRINDGTVNVDTSFVIHVGNINDAPTFTFVPDTMALEDVLYTSTITAVDIDGDTLTFTVPVLPTWLSFIDTTNTLSGTPLNDDVGDDTITLRINDGTVNVDTSFVIHVGNTNDAPTFTSVPDTVTMQGALYAYTATAEDIDVGDTLTFTAPVLPAWLSFDTATHILTGTPGNEYVGNNSVSLMINDGTVDVVQSFVIVVGNVNDPPTFTSTPITEARPGVAYTYTLTAVDIDGDALTYSAIILPGWLTFNASTHILSATPGEGDVGDQHVTIRVSDGTLYTDQTFVITVGYGNHAPTFTSDPATSVVIGNSYVYTITAQDIDGDVLTYSAPVLPGWLTYYPATHVISGVPRSSDLGRHDVTLRVSDGTVSADQSFPITVENVNVLPSFTSTPVTHVLGGELYVYYATAEDMDGDDMTFSAPLLPSWLSFDVNTQVLHGTPDNEDAGDHNVRLRVSDGEGTEDQNFVVTVEVQSGVDIDDVFSPDFMVVYPNPTDGRFFVELSEEIEKEVSLEIMDPLGRILLQEVFPPYILIQGAYDLSDRPPGIYFIRVYHDSSQAIRKLMIH